MNRTRKAWKRASVVSVVSAVAALGLVGAAQAQSGGELRAKHDSLKQQLAASPFGRPLLLQSNESAGEPHGDVYAVADHPFRAVGTALQRAEHWCDVLLLQTNIKRCAPSGSPPSQSLQVAIARKSAQPADGAFQVEFKYAVKSADADYLSVQMAAAAGPLGTSDYKLSMEAVPIDPQHTFIHMSYSYATGVAARMATDAYLATAGRSKVGFSVVGRDDAGKPLYVDGIRGVAERNTMRYFLAIEAVLGTSSEPPEQQADKRLRAWFAATERYPRQLHELSLDEYLAMKRREVRTADTRTPPAPA